MIGDNGVASLIWHRRLRGTTMVVTPVTTRRLRHLSASTNTITTTTTLLLLFNVSLS